MKLTGQSVFVGCQSQQCLHPELIAAESLLLTPPPLLLLLLYEGMKDSEAGGSQHSKSQDNPQ